MDVIRDVSFLLTSSECKRLLAKSLAIKPAQLLQSEDEVFTTIDLWIMDRKDEATLDSLFQFMLTINLFEALKDRLDQRLKEQTSKKGRCFRIILVVV